MLENEFSRDLLKFLARYFFLARLFLEMLSYLEKFPGARISDGAEGLEDSEERDAVDSDSSTNAFFARLGHFKICISREKSFLARKIHDFGSFTKRKIYKKPTWLLGIFSSQPILI